MALKAASGLDHLDLLEGAHLELPDPLARDAELGGQILKVIGSSASHRASKMRRSRWFNTINAQRPDAVVGLLAIAEPLLLVGCLVNQPVLPLAGAAVSSADILLLALRRLKNSFFWLAVVPSFTSDHERRTYS